jgi:hypothetical protein
MNGGDATLVALLGVGLLVVGQWFVFVTTDRWESDQFSRGLRSVARPIRWAGLALLLLGLVIGLLAAIIP